MYQTTGNTVTITSNDWQAAGLSMNQLWYDSRRGYLNIHRRSTRGNTLIDFKSIERPDRLAAIERHLGRLGDKMDRLEDKIDRLTDAMTQFIGLMSKMGTGSAIPLFSGFAGQASNVGKENILFELIEDNGKARVWLLDYYKEKGKFITAATIEKLVNRARIFDSVNVGLEKHISARAKVGKRTDMGTFYASASSWMLEMSATLQMNVLMNARCFENSFKKYNQQGYIGLVNKNIGNDNTRKVSKDTEKLLVSLYGGINKGDEKPFVEDVHKEYTSFLRGKKEFFDKETGLVFVPQDFKEISVGTVWNYVKHIPNIAATKSKRDGWFNNNNNFSPKHERKRGEYSLSKVTMDDVQMTRKSTRGDVTKYVITDCVSGYMFKPAYVIGEKPRIETVNESLRNMWIFLYENDLPAPYEADTEHHLISDMPYMKDLFIELTMNDSATAKRQEHFNRQFKYGVAKRNGHINLRFYGKNAYAGKRIKMKGDFVQPEIDARIIIEDDLSDINEWNNELHPSQKTYPGKTRKDVFFENVNPNINQLPEYFVWRRIGYATETSIVNHKRIRANNQVFWLQNYDILQKLKSNNYDVIAYYRKNADNNAEKIYLYQDNNYLGEGMNLENKRYNENRAEWTDEDRENYEFQNKEQSKFRKMVKDIKAGLPKLGFLTQEQQTAIDMIDDEVETIPNAPLPIEEFACETAYYENFDYAKMALNSI
ncbi:MAG: hypothetical protein LBT04_02935 [Prevotellaceae bacterium]|jgi:hypothetical protein|nr:hypothetical protein [Prevotellaceae bacterium]